ncbi:MAG: SLBB domain-containing protein [Cyanobacteriota bacterium]
MSNFLKVIIISIIIQFAYVSSVYSQAESPEIDIVKENIQIDKTQIQPDKTVKPKAPIDTSYFKSNDSDKNTNNNNQSEIEKLFNGKLKQFGYDMFESSSNISTGGQPSKNYVLYRGDRLKVYFWGDTLDLLNLTGKAAIEPEVESYVDSDGNLFIPGIGLVYGEGRTISDVEQDINSDLLNKYTNITAKIAVESPGDFSVMVVGKVKKPGTVSINASANFLDALDRAGGIIKTGSLREIVHIDSYTKRKTKIDLYKLLINGEYPNIYLKGGDVILVKPIGKVVGIANGVKTPAIYEFKDKETLKNVVEFAGGFLASTDTNEIEVERFDKATGQKNVIEISFSKLDYYLPNDGDLLNFNYLYEKAENIVTIVGNVKHPGVFEYIDGMKLSNILKSRDELMLKTYTEQAVIIRVDGLSKEIIQIPLSLSAFFKGVSDPVLKPQDVVKIFSSTKMGVVEVSGIISNPAFIPFKEGMKLKDIIRLVNFLDNPNEVVAEITNSGVEEESEDAKSLSLNTKIVYLYELLTENDDKLNIQIAANDKIMFRKVNDKEALREVSVSGYVNKPGVYNVRPGMRLSDAIKIAGGLAQDGYLKGLVFLRPSIGEMQRKALTKSYLQLQEDIALKVNKMQAIKDPARKADFEEFSENQMDLLNIMKQKIEQDYGRVVLNIESNYLEDLNNEYNLEIRDGDQIIIPYIPQHVTIIGEVSNQSAIAFIPGMKPSFYIDQVGGFTKEAKKNRSYIIKASGRTEHLKNFKSIVVEPGDSIIIPRKVRIPINAGQVLKDMFGMAFQTTGMVYMIDRIGSGR